VCRRAWPEMGENGQRHTQRHTQASGISTSELPGAAALGAAPMAWVKHKQTKIVTDKLTNRQEFAYLDDVFHILVHIPVVGESIITPNVTEIAPDERHHHAALAHTVQPGELVCLPKPQDLQANAIIQPQSNNQMLRTSRRPALRPMLGPYPLMEA
jgi:hypothetical protein